MLQEKVETLKLNISRLPIKDLFAVEMRLRRFRGTAK